MGLFKKIQDIFCPNDEDKNIHINFVNHLFNITRLDSIKNKTYEDSGKVSGGIRRKANAYLEKTSSSISQLSSKLKIISMAYYISEDSKYYRCFIDQINDWFFNDDIGEDLRYESNIKDNIKDIVKEGSLEEIYKYIYVIESIFLINTIRPITNTMMYNLQKWCEGLIYLLENDNSYNFDLDDDTGIMYDTLLIYLYAFVNGKINIEIKKRLFNRINHHLLSSGEQPYELIKESAMHYSIYNIEHIIDAYKIFKNFDDFDINDYTNKIDSGLQFLYSFTNKKEFENAGYQEINDWDLEMNYLDIQAGRVDFSTYDFYSDIEFILL